MIALILDETLQKYEQDLREILMAFFPGEPFCYDKRPEAGLFVCADKDGIRVEVRGAENASEAAGSTGTSEAEAGKTERQQGRRQQAALLLTDVRRENKTRVKHALYTLLSELTGEQLPWGTLTGIRPVKLADMLLTELENSPAEACANTVSRAETDRLAAAKLQETYLISPEKTALMLDIAHRERTVLSCLDYRRGFSLYIGIPFCPTTCLYCSFTSYPIARWSGRVDEYIACLRRELRQLRSFQTGAQTSFLFGRPLQTIYIGGGTPTALSAEQLRELLEIVREELDLSEVAEFTVEAGRPDSITAEKLQVLRAFGIDRISINPQTMNQKTLDLIGRRHTVEDVKRAFYEARKAGFDNINMDLIMGLPEETADDVRHTLSEIEAMRPDSLTVHALAVKRAARLNTEGNAWAHLARAGKEEASLMTELGAESAACMGLYPYYLYRQKNMAGNQENVGYAAPGKENLYNILMMEERHTVIGCGAGASSKAVFAEETDRQETAPAAGKQLADSAAAERGPVCGTATEPLENSPVYENDGEKSALAAMKNTAPAASAGGYRVERHENMKNIAEYLPRFEEVLEKKAVFLA